MWRTVLHLWREQLASVECKLDNPRIVCACFAVCMFVSGQVVSLCAGIGFVLWAETDRINSKGETEIRVVCPHANNPSSWERHGRYIER